jgi:PD-(D/E)XK endonuclease
MFNQDNSKKQGDVGVGQAIAWFTRNSYTVSIPLTDSQDYDLIVDKDNKLYRVQVKTASYKNEYGIYEVSLTVKGGNRSGTGRIKSLDKSKVDLLFILTSDNEVYVIPSDVVGVNSINLGKKVQGYKYPV